MNAMVPQASEAVADVPPSAACIPEPSAALPQPGWYLTPHGPRKSIVLPETDGLPPEVRQLCPDCGHAGAYHGGGSILVKCFSMGAPSARSRLPENSTPRP